MANDRFLIAPIQTGLQTDLKNWLIADDAYEQLDNVYVFRGRVRKRFGGRLTGTGSTSDITAPLFSRARIALTGGSGVGTTDGAGSATGTIPGSKFKVGQAFSIGEEIFTVSSLGIPSTMLTTGSSTTMTFNTTSGVFVFAGASLSTQIFFYPAEPIMGITLYEQGAIIQHDAYAFDTQFAYKYSGGSWIRIGTAVWKGNNSNFFWATNWEGANTSLVQLFVTNYNAVKSGAPGANDDPIYSFDGTTWTAFNPKFLTAGSGNYVQTCRIIVPFKDRLILLNTIETNSTATTNSHYPARCRYSHNGVPFPASPVKIGTTSATGALAGTLAGGATAGKVGQMYTIGNEVFTVTTGAAGVQVMARSGSTWKATTYTFNITTGAYNFVAAAPLADLYFYASGGSAWLEHNQAGWDGAGWIDASTDEEIISAEFIKDRLIVYFERSTWELAYTGNQVQPFVWQKINTELGSDATFSSVAFDKAILTIGNVGIHACSGGNVERIDTKIPNKIFDIRGENNGIERINGIRDFYTEAVYWTLPQVGCDALSNIFPNKVLVYNYKNDSWAMNDDCITCFGYFEQQDDTVWANADFSWTATERTWVSGISQADFRSVLAGNQQGYVFIADSTRNTNAPVMQITDIAYAANTTTLTIENHSLHDGDYIYIKNGLVTGVVSLDLNENNYRVSVATVNTITIGDKPFTGVYLGGASATRVSRINIKSKQWNPYIDKGQNVELSKIDFCVERTSTGAVTVDYFASSSGISLLTDGLASGTTLGTNVLETSPYTIVTSEGYQDRLWHSVYFQGDGNGVQINIKLSDEQMLVPAITQEAFSLEGLILHLKPSSRLE